MREHPHTKDNQSLCPHWHPEVGLVPVDVYPRRLPCELWHWQERVQSHLRGAKSRRPLLKPTESWLSQRKWRVPRYQLHLPPHQWSFLTLSPCKTHHPPSWHCFCPCFVAGDEPNILLPFSASPWNLATLTPWRRMRLISRFAMGSQCVRKSQREGTANRRFLSLMSRTVFRRCRYSD